MKVSRMYELMHEIEDRDMIWATRCMLHIRMHEIRLLKDVFLYYRMSSASKKIRKYHSATES